MPQEIIDWDKIKRNKNKKINKIKLLLIHLLFYNKYRKMCLEFKIMHNNLVVRLIEKKKNALMTTKN
jgi:hypothetical protein